MEALLKTVKEKNLQAETIVSIFHDICSASKTENGTTAMFLAEPKVKSILARNYLVEVALECVTGNNNTIHTPSLLALLQLGGLLTTNRRYALIIVDVQNDFISGSLAVGEGDQVVPVINNLGSSFDIIYKTADWHPSDHISFHSNVCSGHHPLENPADTKMFETVKVKGPPSLNQTLWPDHCVQGSKGAEFHPDLKVFPGEVKILKGMTSTVDSYSAFWDNGDTYHTPLYEDLLKRGVTDVVVCGLATDYCVGFTALDAARHGLRTFIVEEAVRGVAPETTAAMLERCRAAQIKLIKSRDVSTLVTTPSPLTADVVAAAVRTTQAHFSTLDA